MKNLRWLTFHFLGAIVLSSCFPRALSLYQGDADWGVQIQWHGHSCFSLKDSTGRTVVIDPFDETVGYEALRLKADALMITHSHFDHNDKRAVRPLHRILDVIDSSTGTTDLASGLSVLGIESYHDQNQGEIHGKNSIYVFSMGGLRFAHFGDIGTPLLTAEQLAKLGTIDVAFVPVGGVTTLNAAQAQQLIKQIKPSWIFPMHFGNVRFYPLDSLDLFSRLFDSKELINAPQSGIRLRRAELTESPRVVILESTSRND